ncbi:MAG: hypothetical protein ACNA8W_20355 [Bradymonadaceae bacterium]
MSSAESTDKILDLLYGEHPPEETEALRHEPAMSEEDMAELASFEQTLSTFRDGMPQEEVPSSVHAAIMAQAREHATKNVIHSARAERGPSSLERAPAQRPGNLWSRLSVGPIAQIATVASLLLVGAIFIRHISQEAEPQFSAASTATEAYVAFDLPHIDLGEEPAAEAEQPEQDGLAMIDGEPSKADKEPEGYALDQKEIAAVDNIDRSSRGGRSAPVARRRAAPRPMPSSDIARSESARPQQAPQAQRTPSKKSATVDADQDFDPFGGDSLGAASPAPERRAKSAPQPRPEEKAKSESADFAVPLFDDSTIAEAESVEEEAPQPSALERAEAAQRAQNHAEAQREAERALVESTSSTERARAMEIVAQSLLAMGRYEEADRIFANLESEYPDYRSNTVSTARDGIARRRQAQRRQADEAAEEEKSAEPVQGKPEPFETESAMPRPTSY